MVNSKNIIMNRLISFLLVAIFMISCSEGDYVIGGEPNTEMNKVDKTTFQFLESFEPTTKTAKLIEKAGMVDEVNGDVTVIAPSNYAIDRYIRRRNNRMLRQNPDTTQITIDDIPADTLQKLGMYIVDNKYWRNNLTDEWVYMPTHNPDDSLRLALLESNDSPGTAWDGAGIPGWGYQYSNFMQTTPEKVYVQFKRGNNWEQNDSQRAALGLDHPESDKKYRMYISDIQTNTGIVHVIYSDDYSYSSHYYYHTLFFFGTRQDDQL